MKTVQKASEMIPGIRSLYVIPKRFLLHTFSPNMQFSKPVSEIIYRLDFAMDSCLGSIRAIQTDAGIYYQCDFQAFIPGNNKENISMLKELMNDHLLTLWQTYDGYYWRIGDINTGLKLQYNQITSPRIGFDVNLTGKVLQPQTRSIYDSGDTNTIYM